MGTIRRFDLQKFKSNFKIDFFIETGTLYGDGVKYALEQSFNKIVSVEIDKDLTDQARNLFKSIKEVTIECGKSSEVLKRILPPIDQNILFWLDAHFPGADSGKSRMDSEKNYDIRLPLEKELEVISKRSSKYRDVIIADDLWIYEDGNYTRSFDDHCKIYHPGITRDQICGRNLDFVHNLFSKTHTLEKYYEHQGYILLTPQG